MPMKHFMVRFGDSCLFHNLDRATFYITNSITDFNFGPTAGSDLKRELQVPESVHSKHLGKQRLKKKKD